MEQRQSPATAATEPGPDIGPESHHPPDHDTSADPPPTPTLVRRNSTEMVRILMKNTAQPQSISDVIDELSTVELAIKHIQQVFISRSSSIREAFRKLDPESYGYIAMGDFRTALDDDSLAVGNELSMEEKDMVCIFADVKGTGKIDYLAFFNLLFRDHYQAKRELIASSTLRQVVVVFRHGARFPLKPFPMDSSWPKDAIFWKTYGGKLTPTGQAQCYHLGELLRAKYLQEEHLLGEDDPDLPDALYVYTSNSDRTLMSAQSLLLGMFPNVSQSFAIERKPGSSDSHPASSDHDDDDDDDDDDSYPVQGQYQTIKIHLADMSVQYLPLLHGHKNNPLYNVLKADAFQRSSVFTVSSLNPAYIDLLQKLYQMTGFDAIRPEVPIVQRLQVLQTLYQQIAIERAHRMRLFANRNHIWFEPNDERLIRTMAEYTVRLRYQGLDGDDQRRMSRLAAGTLPIEIVNAFRGVVNGESPRKLALYSAHDNTIMALLSHLGYRDWDVPQFGGHCIFELHQDRDRTWSVRFAYNDSIDRLERIRYVQLPLNHEIVNWSDTVAGHTDFAQFEHTLRHERQSIKNDVDWNEQVKVTL